MSNQVLGVVSIHRLRTGATVQLYLSVKKGLYQNIVGSKCTPDWAIETNQPVITPTVTGATMSEPKWYKDGSQISNDGINYTIDANGVLTFRKSPVDFNNIHNITYTFKCKVTTGGTTEDIERTIMVMVHEGGENSYWGNINAQEGTVLGQIIEGGTESTKESLTLEATLWCGSAQMEYDKDYIVKWFKTAGYYNKDKNAWEDVELIGNVDKKHNADRNRLTVYRDLVDGMAHIECRYYSKDGSVFLEAEGIQIADNADQYFISISGDKNVYTGSGSTVNLSAGVFKHGTNSKVEKISAWDVIVTDSERMGEYPASTYNIVKNTASSTGDFSMLESNMYVPNTDPATKLTKPWMKLGDASTPDTAVTSIKEATPCDVIVQFIATI